MMKDILNTLKPQAEQMTAAKQAGCRTGRSTTDQIFNLGIVFEKFSHYQQNMYHVFTDFKTAFDTVWHATLLATMRKYNINANVALQ